MGLHIMEMVQKVYEALVIAFIIFVGQDYLRFRFSPPYATKKECEDCRVACGKLQEARASKIDALTDVVNALMDRLARLVMRALNIEV